MIAKVLVGKWVCSNYLEDPINAPVRAKFKVVGYTTYGDCIVDAGSSGWQRPGIYDRIVEECDFYGYLRIEDIFEVL